jgi:signal transduction histidine kinase/ActR/RegA family two-component response regulator
MEAGLPEHRDDHAAPSSAGTAVSTRFSRALRAYPLPTLSGPMRYAVAVLGPLFSALVQYALLPEPSISPFVFFYFSVALVSWLAGRGPGLLSVVLSALVANYMFVSPHRDWALSGPALTAIALFLISAAAVSLLCASFRNALLAARRTAVVLRRQGDLLRAKEAELIEADRRKTEFLAMLSHELRNPLAPIRNSLYILDRAAPGGDQARRAQRVIDRQVNHLARLVGDLLDVVRISRGKTHLKLERLDVADLVAHTAEDHRASFAHSGLELEVRVPARPIWVQADRVRVAQLVGNLLNNASKFTEHGGKATVSLEEDPRLGQVAIRIQDTGAGIAPEMLPRLFEPFIQADRSLARSRGGLGLGLAVVKGLAEMHAGTVSASSEGLGKGAEFTVRLPLDSSAAPTGTEPREAPQSAPSRRVLVIEDNVDAADTLRQALELRGHAVEVAYTAESGLARVRASKPDVVFCDIGLPGMDGYEVGRAIRGDPALQATMLVALTGYAAPEDIHRSREAGFQYHVAKPPSFEEIERILMNAGSGAPEATAVH